MPRLANVRHELFCQARVTGLSPGDSYLAAGYRGNPDQASIQAWAIGRRPDVAERIDELMAEAAERAKVKAEDVLRELSRIAFIDPRSVVRWVDSQAEIYEASPDDLDDDDVAALEDEVKAGTVEKTPEGWYRKSVIIRPGVMLRNSDEITRDAAAAIAEVGQTAHGLKVKFHSKLPALEMLGKYLQMWQDNQASKGVPFAITDQPQTTEEWLDAFADKSGKTQH